MSERKIRRIFTSILINKITQEFLNNFVGGEVEVRKGKNEYCFQGAIRSIVLQDGRPKRITVVFDWVAQRVFPLFKRKEPFSKEENYGWIVRLDGDGYEMTVGISSIFNLKTNRDKTLGVLDSGGEIARFMKPGDHSCIGERLGLSERKVDPPVP